MNVFSWSQTSLRRIVLVVVRKHPNRLGKGPQSYKISPLWIFVQGTFILSYFWQTRIWMKIGKNSWWVKKETWNTAKDGGAYFQNLTVSLRVFLSCFRFYKYHMWLTFNSMHSFALGTWVKQVYGKIGRKFVCLTCVAGVHLNARKGNETLSECEKIRRAGWGKRNYSFSPRPPLSSLHSPPPLLSQARSVFLRGKCLLGLSAWEMERKRLLLRLIYLKSSGTIQ